MTFHIVTLFKESFGSYVGSSIVGRAVRDKKIKVKFYNPRDFTKGSPSHKAANGRGKWRRIDHKPYGGGPGMVIEAEAVIKAVETTLKKSEIRSAKSETKIIWLTPSGKQFDNKIAESYAKKVKHLIIICGRYEGIDERAFTIIKKLNKGKIEKLSIGPYVLTGGELPAMVILDAVSRRVPGVLGKIESVEENRISSPAVYTRPEILAYKGRKYRVPKILLSGHHKKIEEWKKSKKQA